MRVLAAGHGARHTAPSYDRDHAYHTYRAARPARPRPTPHGRRESRGVEPVEQQVLKSLGTRSQGARLERIRSSRHWAGDQFRNTNHTASPPDPNVPMPTLRDFIWGGERRVPQGPLPALNPLAPWTRPAASGLRATWLGHSTVLLEIDGLRVLTDPVWGPRASPLSFLGPKRFQPVPVPLQSLPPIDLVLVSHDHYDHLDYPTIRGLARLDVPLSPRWA